MKTLLALIIIAIVFLLRTKNKKNDIAKNLYDYWRSKLK
jgi:hypothetical protein